MIEWASIPNPFRDNVVQDAWQNPADVAEIHKDAFEACLAGIDSAARAVPDSLLIYGPAGSGKTHLLARLQRHLSETSRQAPDAVLRCVFVFVRLQTAPQLLWQHVRRRLASDLMRRDHGMTQLQRLVAHQFGIRAGYSPRSGILELRVLRKEDQDELSARLTEVARTLELPRDLCVVLEHLIHDRAVRDASAWLAGESLPESVLDDLRLGQDVLEDREEAAKQTVTALCHLAGETLPIVFCFDQVEALQQSMNDRDALFRFGRMAADLHDADRNVFLITCLQSALLEDFDAAVRGADADRVVRRRVVLEPLTPDQVERLVCARLELSEPIAAARAQREHPGSYPLPSNATATLSAIKPCVPRKILATCTQLYEQLQRDEPVEPRPLPLFLGNELEARREKAARENQPSDTTRILIHGAPIISVLGEIPVSTQTGKVDLLLGEARNIAVSIRNEADGRSLGPKLRALSTNGFPVRGGRLVIVRDPRLPIPKTAKKATEYLSDIQKKGAVAISPTVEALAALAALSSLLSDAKSGDLANDGDCVTESAVIAWLRGLRGDPRIEPISDWVQQISQSKQQDPDELDLQDLAAALARDHVSNLEVVSRQMGRAPEHLLQVARRNPDRFAVLDGPPTVLLDISGVVAGGEA